MSDLHPPFQKRNSVVQQGLDVRTRNFVTESHPARIGVELEKHRYPLSGFGADQDTTSSLCVNVMHFVIINESFHTNALCNIGMSSRTSLGSRIHSTTRYI